jgi:predicted aspartyl protease
MRGKAATKTPYLVLIQRIADKMNHRHKGYIGIDDPGGHCHIPSRQLHRGLPRSPRFARPFGKAIIDGAGRHTGVALGGNAALLPYVLLVVVLCGSAAFADRQGWERKEVNWRVSAGRQVKAIYYPRHQQPPLLETRSERRPVRLQQRAGESQVGPTGIITAEGTAAMVFANVIDSPPVDGFVPWIAVSVTDARLEPLELEAVTEYSIAGNFLTGSPESDYAIGILDTGASIHLMGNAAASRAGLFSADLVTSNTTIISGVTGDTEVWVSYPIGVFIDGLGAIEPNGLLLDRTGMMGQSNVAIAVGQGIEPVDLPTAIGSPLCVYFTAVFNNEAQVTVDRDGNEFTAPDIRIYPQDDPEIPTYANKIPLELRPLGGINVQYLFDVGDFEFPPISPSVITGNLSQSIFFVASVDMYEGGHSAIDKTRFMFDTGAQITVIGSRIAARLDLDPDSPDFEVEIQGVTGDTIIAPGFYIDVIDIPALGDWLSFTNAPAVLLDAPSPEGGTVDGIIGMNLFVDLDFVLRGGGLFLQDDPSVEYQPIARLAGDIAPDGGDGAVDWLDLAALADAWLAEPLSPNWNSRADMVSDAIIDFHDFAILAQNWLQ